MIAVKLELEDWNRVLGILAGAPWATANPLIMQIGEQVRSQVPKPNGSLEPSVASQEPTRQ